MKKILQFVHKKASITKLSSDGKSHFSDYLVDNNDMDDINALQQLPLPPGLKTQLTNLRKKESVQLLCNEICDAADNAKLHKKNFCTFLKWLKDEYRLNSRHKKFVVSICEHGTWTIYEIADGDLNCITNTWNVALYLYG